MNLYIPKIGETIKLLEPWTFTLHSERRNWGLYDHLHPDANAGGKRSWQRARVESEQVILPAGVRLTFDRYYMAKVNTMYRRSSSSDYHSITFVIKKNSNQMGNTKQLRFWVKLADANKIVFEKVED